MARPVVRYQNSIMDSGRWDEITLREGDVVISTPPKSGTTWTGMICALLILQTTELPQSLADLSPWVDMLVPSRAEMRAVYDSQSHRRFFKTHTPLDGLPIDDGVSYICVGRDPRDAAFSWFNHIANLNIDLVSELVEATAAAENRPATSAREHLEGIPPEAPPCEQFLAWVGNPLPLGGLDWLVAHLASFWAARTWSNVILLHYDDLLGDLSGQMRLLAEWLHIDVPADRWGELVTAAKFTSMSRRADKLAPGPVWREPSRFFHKGTSGQWRDVLDAEAEQCYWKRVRELAAPDLVAWLHRRPATDGGVRA